MATTFFSSGSVFVGFLSVAPLELFWGKMHPPLTIYKHPMCAEIIEAFQKCHSDHPVGKFFGECTELKIKLDRCFRQEVSSQETEETLQAYRKETAEEAIKRTSCKLNYEVGVENPKPPFL
ncbi:hypothetical protein AAG906_003827 [Vitis piasezkii]